MEQHEKIKIKTAIEKELHKVICVNVKDHIRDFVILTAQRNRMPIERAQVEQLVRVVETAVDDAYHRNVDSFTDKILENAEKYSNKLEEDLFTKKIEIPKEETRE